jgi:hypothetical protein
LTHQWIFSALMKFSPHGALLNGANQSCNISLADH